MRFGKLLMGAGAAFLVISGGVGIYQLYHDGGLPNLATGSGQAEADSPWALQRTSDKMTDETIVSAATRIEAAHHLFDVTIACRNGEEITYDFTAFDAEQKAATLRHWDRYLSDFAIRFQVRVDQQDAIDGYVINPRYTNELLIGPNTSGVSSLDMSMGAKIIVRLIPDGGEEILEVDQNDPNVRFVLNACDIGPSQPEGDQADGSPEISQADEAVLAATAYDLTDKRLISAFAAATGHSSMFLTELDDQSAYVTPLKLLDMPFGQVLLTHVTVKEPGHAATGAMGVYYLQQDGDRFILKKSWKEAIRAGGSGIPPEKWSLTDKFTSYAAIYMEDGYAQMGQASAWSSLIELRPEGPTASDAILTYYSNKSAVLSDGEKPVELKGKIINIRRDEGFDVVDEKAGIRESYIRSGTKFVRAGGGDSKFPAL